MSKSKHTPGPWVYDEYYGLIMASDQVEVAACHAGTGKDSKANARLIAAAPEMLEALKECLVHLKSRGFTQEFQDRIGSTLLLSQLAIAKAEGRDK